MTESSRSKTAFVLAGGGSLGAVEVGMLETLVDRGISADLVVGSSAGAINAAYFAARPDAEGVRSLGQIWRGLHRRDVFPFAPLGSLLSFFSLRNYLVDPTPLRCLLERQLPYRDMARTAIPLHVVATDILNGTEVVLSSGSAIEAVLASAAIPAVFPPVKLKGRYLADGGLANNTPISVAVALGADRVIVLPTGFSCDVAFLVGDFAGATELHEAMHRELARSTTTGLLAQALRSLGRTLPEKTRTEVEDFFCSLLDCMETTHEAVATHVTLSCLYVYQHDLAHRYRRKLPPSHRNPLGHVERVFGRAEPRNELHRVVDSLLLFQLARVALSPTILPAVELLDSLKSLRASIASDSPDARFDRLLESLAASSALGQMRRQLADSVAAVERSGSLASLPVHPATSHDPRRVATRLISDFASGIVSFDTDMDSLATTARSLAKGWEMQHPTGALALTDCRQAEKEVHEGFELLEAAVELPVQRGGPQDTAYRELPFIDDWAFDQLLARSDSLGCSLFVGVVPDLREYEPSAPANSLQAHFWITVAPSPDTIRDHGWDEVRNQIGDFGFSFQARLGLVMRAIENNGGDAIVFKIDERFLRSPRAMSLASNLAPYFRRVGRPFLVTCFDLSARNLASIVQEEVSRCETVTISLLSLGRPGSFAALITNDEDRQMWSSPMLPMAWHELGRLFAQTAGVRVLDGSRSSADDVWRHVACRESVIVPLLLSTYTFRSQ